MAHKLRGDGKKELRSYEHLRESAEEEARYWKKFEQVAARTVMKNPGQKGRKAGA